MEGGGRVPGARRVGWIACMHTGGRSAAGIDAGRVLPGYAGTIVRDGYAGYQHLADALHAWCGAHDLRDLRVAPP